MEKTVVNIDGMTCQACQKLVSKRITSLGGVNSVVVDLTNGQVEITAERKLDSSDIMKVLEGTPYSVKS